MKPALAFPYNDPDGTMLPHMLAILPDLKTHFDHAYIAPPHTTLSLLQQKDLFLRDDFFTVLPVDGEKQIGERFAYVYRRAAELAPPEQLIHLCYPDRMAFALEGAYRESFLADITSLTTANVPLIFQRSEFAWSTHPANYRQLEGIVTTVAENLLGRALDYGWCHLVAQAKHLRAIMPKVHNPDLSMVAEMVFHLHDQIQTRDVDWLAWEDPFIFERDAAELKHEREHSLDETNKRLKYVLPMLATLTRLASNGKE